MALREDILNPVSVEQPCGVPAGQVKGFDKLRDMRKPNEQAIEAFLRPRQPGEPPKLMTRDMWAPKELNKFIEAASEMIATKSKDLELAAWLTEALLWKDDLAGLSEGLTLIKGLLEAFWDTLHPLPDEGDYYMRIRHLEWMGMSENTRESSPPLALGFVAVTADGHTVNDYWQSRSIPYEADASGNAAKARKEAVNEGKLPPEEFDGAFDATPKAFYKGVYAAATASTEALAEIEALCSRKFGSDPPGFVTLKAALERAEGAARILLEKKLERDPDPVEAPAAREAASPGEGEQPQAPATPAAAAAFADLMAGAGDISGLEPKSWQEAVIRIAAAAHYMRRQSPSHPSPYLVLRGLRWGELYASGAEIPGSQLAAPPPDARSSLRTLALQNRWADVIETGESAMASECGRAWLDLHRYVVQACDQVGHANVSRALRSVLNNLLTDYPGLSAMTMTDDTGTANPDTLAWLNSKMGDGE